MVTIHDIAEKAEVSTATVSRVLNRKSSSKKTEARVRKVIDELHYTPNALAAGLRTAKQKKLGIIIPDISNPFYPSSVRAFYEAAKHRGYNIILGNTYGRVKEELEVLNLMSRERVAGIMVETCEGEEDRVCYPVFRDMAGSGVHIVLLGKKRSGLMADMLSVNHRSGAYKAVKYLLRSGRKKIAFICGAVSDFSGEQRYEGYRQALSEAGINLDENLVSFGEWTIESGIIQGKNVLGRTGADGIFCANDLLALGAMDAARGMHINIPGDAALVGFDNIQFASFCSPKLTTVHQPIEKLAHEACNLLIDRIEGRIKDNFREILVEPELVVRESA